jgi:hypothetical protein
MPDEAKAPEAAAPQPEAPAAAAPGCPGRVPLLVVCGCAFLVVVAVGIKWTGERRADAECRGRLEQLWTAARKEAEAREGKLPSGARATDDLVMRYLHHQRFWSCPQTGTRYLWTSRERRLGDDPRKLLAWETRPHGWPVGRHRALFVDGRIEELSGEELKSLLARERREPPPARPAGGARPDLGPDPGAAPPGWRVPPKPSQPEPGSSKPPGSDQPGAAPVSPK